MTRIIIAGDSWGAHSYERDYVHKDLEGFKWKPKKNYVLYPGPGDFLSKLTPIEVITVADHGVSNTEAFDNLNKVDHSKTLLFFTRQACCERCTRHTWIKNQHIILTIVKQTLSTTQKYSIKDVQI